MIMFCAMGPPGGGKSIITSRMVRHFNLLAYTELDDGSIKSIFNNLMKYFFKSFNDGIKVLYNNIKGCYSFVNRLSFRSIWKS